MPVKNDVLELQNGLQIRAVWRKSSKLLATVHSRHEQQIKWEIPAENSCH
jgi:hypothetical protein